MITGAAALFVYSCLVSWIILRYKWHSLAISASVIIVWRGVAFGLRVLVLK